MLRPANSDIINNWIERKLVGGHMGTSSPHQVTELLLDWRNGDQQALDKLAPLIYDELRRLAESYLRRERPGHTLQATALVNEAFLQLLGSNQPGQVDWQNRAHFFGIAARLMRRILVDHARAHAAGKRGSGQDALPLDDAIEVPGGRATDVVALDDALQDLAAFDARKSQVIEVRYFGGLSIEETAEVVGISVATVRRELRMAEAWLYQQMQKL
ncbi:MAG: sigma-70 family RNA polymerase sigma factor [Blastocatellia bacterium]